MYGRVVDERRPALAEAFRAFRKSVFAEAATSAKTEQLVAEAAAHEALDRFLGRVERCLVAISSRVAAEAVAFRLSALAHGMASLAVEEQALVDVAVETLARATRDATADLLASVGSRSRPGQRSTAAGTRSGPGGPPARRREPL